MGFHTPRIPDLVSVASQQGTAAAAAAAKMASAPPALYGGPAKSRTEFNESIHHPADDVIFRSQVLAASYNPKTPRSVRHDSISGLSQTIRTSPGIYRSPVYRPPTASVQVVQAPDSPPTVVPVHVAASTSASHPHVAGGRVVVAPTHTVRAVYADAYESLRLGHPAAVLEEMLYFRPGLARQCDSNGVTLLHWACYYRSEPAIFELLLRVNPDAARRGSQNDGCLPLHVAASWGCSIPIIALLFSAFPESVNVADLWGNLPVDKATQMGHQDIVPLLTPTERLDRRPITRRPSLARRNLRDDLEDPHVSANFSTQREQTVDHTSSESIAWRQQRDADGSSGPSLAQQRSECTNAAGRDSLGTAASGYGDTVDVAASHRANDRSISENKELRRELAVQRTAISHRIARLEHTGSISAAERDNLQCALSAEKRRADKLQRQLDRIQHSAGAASSTDTSDLLPPSSVKITRRGSTGAADESLANAIELSQTVDGALYLMQIFVDLMYDIVDTLSYSHFASGRYSC